MVVCSLCVVTEVQVAASAVSREMDKRGRGMERTFVSGEGREEGEGTRFEGSLCRQPSWQGLGLGEESRAT